MRWLLTLCLIACTGCLSTLDTKVMEARTAKYDADVVFAALMRQSVAAGDEGWNGKFAMQRLLIRKNWAAWLQINGMTVDAAGNPTGGTVSIPLMLQSLEQVRAEEDQLVEAQMRWSRARETLLVAIDAYEQTNTTMYATEQEALEAKQEAMAAIDTALHAIGVIAGAAMGAAVVAP